MGFAVPIRSASWLGGCGGLGWSVFARGGGRLCQRILSRLAMEAEAGLDGLAADGRVLTRCAAQQSNQAGLELPCALQ